ncbi:hypothetical protein F183_A25880 [Bryobacterales bacterium F-183]|nr:hypothetical protein F183_A25880 [Bryobacterales bacterium F-183]
MRNGTAVAAAFLIPLTVLAATLAERDAAFIGKRRTFWSYVKPVAAPVPAGAKNPVDAFLLEALAAKKLTFSPVADKHTLVRRVTLDLTGLPPKPEEVDAFVNDKSPNAYEKLVDRLMASKHYGERWGLRWLDVVRYADTNGFELDAERTHAWRYRDYVIDSFNANKKYDRFLQEQIAGDELWPGNNEALIATGFLRAGPEHVVGGNVDEEQNRQEVLTEMTTITGSALLGMTLQCARCHNHKFDPIPQSDHYRLQAVFASTEGKEIAYVSEADRKAYEEAKKAYDAKIKVFDDAVKKIDAPYKKQIMDERRKKLDPEHLAALEIPKDKRTKEQQVLAKEAEDQITPLWDEVVALLPADEKAKRYAIRKERHAVEYTEPMHPGMAYAVANMEKTPDTHILKIGDHKMKLDVVPAGLPQVLVDPAANFPQTAVGRRTSLAQWLTSKENPLTARVMVNRIWQFRFGTGLVGTPNDFGALGARPTNQKLLDWLAVEFMDKGWDIRHIDRMLVLSNAYRQATSRDAAKAAIDPDNKLYWRMNKRRLEGEAIRDSVLAASGALNTKMYGPGVRVPIEKEVYDLIFTEHETDNLWPLPLDKTEMSRRSVYLLNKRTVRLPMLANFDQPDTMSSCAMRSTSTHALQALNLMNSGFMQEQSKRMAERLERDCKGKRGCEIEQAYRLSLGRKPSTEETRMALQFLSGDNVLSDFTLALFNRNEFVYVP